MFWLCWLSLVGCILLGILFLFCIILVLGKLSIIYYWDKQDGVGCVDITINDGICLLKLKVLENDGLIWYQIGKRELVCLDGNKLVKKFRNERYSRTSNRDKEISTNTQIKKKKFSIKTKKLKTKHIDISKVLDEFVPIKNASTHMNILFCDVDYKKCGMLIGMLPIFKVIYSQALSKFFAGKNNLDMICEFENMSKLKLGGRVDIKFGIGQIILKALRILFFRRRYYG